MNEISACMYIGITLGISAGAAAIAAYVAYKIGYKRGSFERDEQIAEENDIQR